ncbi:hypothetical protein TWF481_009640 [Arthrobotrys musiformis]|uniref:Uncharacterized protein n=1 Tax=Arthrobotrys musiformis TaxID=47236 RepID=A0AAV9W4A8_9PEZI
MLRTGTTRRKRKERRRDATYRQKVKSKAKVKMKSMNGVERTVRLDSQHTNRGRESKGREGKKSGDEECDGADEGGGFFFFWVVNCGLKVF